MKFLKRWLTDSTTARTPARVRKLGVEHLEERAVPAVTLPDVPNAQGLVQSSNPTVIPGGVAPELIQNPIRLDQVLLVSTTGGGITFTVSNDLGLTWTQRASNIAIETDPLLRQAQAVPSAFTVIDAPSIAFDRSDTFYMAHIQRNADNTSGVLVADKFTIDSAGNVANLNQRRVLYRWVNQDPVFNPSVGVHSDIQEATDPQTGAVQQNPNTTRGVYVAWNTNATQRSIIGSITSSAVFLAVSDDAGLTYSDPVGVNGGAANGHEGPLAFLPEVQFGASKVDGTAGGNLAVLYKTNTSRTDENGVAVPVPGGELRADVSNPFDPVAGGQLPANPLTVQRTYNGQTGAIGGAAAVTLPDGTEVLTETVTDFTVNVDLTTVGGFDTLRDMSVTLGVYSQGIDQILIQLVPPAGSNLPTVTLLNSRQVLVAGALEARFDNNGGVYGSGVGINTTPGLPGGNPTGIGLVRNGTTVLQTFGLVFDQQAARYVNDPANLAPYILRVRPEDFFVDGNGRLGLNKYNGFDAARLSGDWTLRVTNYKENDDGTPPPPGPRVTQFDLKFISRVNTTGFDAAESTVNPALFDAPATAVTTSGLTGTATTALPLVAQGTQQVGGIQGWYTAAVDTTKGSFSPFQGRMYVAYTGASAVGGAVVNGTGIFVASSDDGGQTWSFPVQVNDQAANDGISNGGRSRFQPTITVDQTTGTVVVMWYDMRWDASDARPATFIATSVDGGVTWSPNAYLNETKSARDAINRSLVDIEPVPSNLSAAGVFGSEQGLIAYNGTVVPVWVGNSNALGRQLLTASTTIAGGPRILQGDMGPVADGFEATDGDPFFPTVLASYNNTFTLDGTRQIDAFYVRFDRRVDPATFTAADVQLRYRDTTGAAAQDISGQVLSVEALDGDPFFDFDAIYGATRFLVRIAPQSRVGTYSYAVGPNISDRIREVVAGNIAPLTNAADVAVTGISTPYGITVTGLTNATAVTANVQLGTTNVPARDLVLRLVNDNGRSILLTLGNGGFANAGTTFAFTTFDDAAPAMGPNGPYGTVQPVEQLSSLLGGGGGGGPGGANGNWFLQAIDLRTGFAITVNTWSLTFTTGGGPQTFTAPSLLPPYSTPASPLSTSTLNVAGQPTLSSTTNTVKVSVKFTDTATNAAFAEDLVLRLTGPDGNSVYLTADRGEGGGGGGFGGNNATTVAQRYAATTFVDSGGAAGGGGQYGYIVPLESLQAAFGGSNPNGVWTLEVVNATTDIPTQNNLTPAARTITLDAWSLTLDNVTFQPDALYPALIPGGGVFTDSATGTAPANLSSISVFVDFSDPVTGSVVTDVSDLLLELIGPNGQTVTLVNGQVAGTGTIGASFDGTRFQDGAPTIAASTAPYSFVAPQAGSLLTAFGGVGGVPGTWQLRVTNLSTGDTIQLDRWQLSFQGGALGNRMDQDADGAQGEGAATPGGQVAESPILVRGAANQFGQAVTVKVSLVDPTTGVPALASDVRITLTGPNGQTVTLADGNGTGTAGAAFANTTFDDTEFPIDFFNAPFGTVGPTGFQSLDNAFDDQKNGLWTLRVTNLSANRDLVLKQWSLILDGVTVGSSGQDLFSNPTPEGGIPFEFPYTVDSLPLIIPGPRLVSSTPNLTADGSTSSIDLTFDKDMLASSFTPDQVLELRTPTGQTINGPFTVIANPPGTPPINANRVFRVTFPTQILSGHYSLLLGAGIKSASGLAMDPNMNAGVELVTGRVVDPTAATVISSDYNTGNIGLAIPPAANGTTPSVTTHTLTVADQFFLTQLLTAPIRVRLDIAVADVRDLSVRLIAPDGTAVQLFTNVGGFGINGFSNFTNTQFSDFAAPNSLIQNAGAPFTGTFLPQQQLSVLDGLSSAGDWKLEITNRSTTQTGTLNFWGLSLPEPVLGNGLGEPVVDQTTVGFRVFTSSPSQPVSYTAWTPVGPTTASDAVNGAEYNGAVTVTAVDPSDPSGNTVYVGGATGGLWKTTNFLTLDAAGPTWIPLLDAASAKAMRISSITVVPQNNDASQDSIVLVGTGDADTRTGGVGFLRSNDGGRTFRLIDSTVNSFNTLPVPQASTDILPVEHPGRDHIFSDNLSYVYKVVVDPVRLGNGEFVMYAAVGGDAAAAGLWRSITSGRSWVRIRAGEATDFVLGPNRVDVLDANGNPVQTVGGTGTPTLRLADIGYAAFAGANGGVFFSQSISTTSSLAQLNGGQGKPLFPNTIVGNLGTNPGQNPTRILLAAVNATANADPLAARVYQGWLYALVIGGGAPGLYMTKDFGANWTLVDLDTTTNNESLGGYMFGNNPPINQYDYGTSQLPNIAVPRYHALAADPTDPNVVYLGGAVGVFRIDVSTLNDAHAQVGGDNSKGGVGPQTESTIQTLNPASAGGLVRLIPGNPLQVDTAPRRASDPYDGSGTHFNRLRDPLQPFVTTGTQFVGGSAQFPAVFTNTGENAHMTQFLGVTGNNRIRNIETVFDPLTRKTRVLVSTELGVFTAADEADATRNQGIYGVAGIVDSIGSAVSVNGNRSSNLSLADVVQTAVQPSELAADLAGLFNRPSNSGAGQWIYSVTEQAYINAPRGILRPESNTYGQEQWQAEVLTDPYIAFIDGTRDFIQTAGYAQTDPQGSGVVYQYRPSYFTYTTGPDPFGAPSTDIFSVSLPGQPSIGRTNGLFANGFGEWNSLGTAYFAVNPADPLGVVISAPNTGRVYLTTDQGVNWFEAGAPATFGNSQGTALAFGGLDPTNPTGDRNGFFYNGTAQGRIWVTFDAGSNWTEISAGLSGGRILEIIANTRTGTYDAYAITATGVFYKADSRTAAAWVNVTGDLFSVTKPVFGEAVAAPILSAPDAAADRVGLTSLAVDWRYAVNGNPPVLYAAGDTGVFRSTDGGATWALFPANLGTATLADDGGYLPNARITDLNLIYGDLNSTGVPNQFNGRNVLVASTYGRGEFAIRVDTSDVPVGLGSTGPFVNTAPLTPPSATTGVASITLNFGDANNTVRVSADTLNAANMAIVGPNGVRPAFTVTDISPPGGNGGPDSVLSTFRIDFTPPVTGTYRLQMNTDVRDTSGRRLNQDRNGTNGQNPSDFFIQDYAITVNRPPTITAVPNQGLVVNTSSGALTFTVGDPDAGDLAGLTVTRSSSDNFVLSTADIVLGGTGANRTVTVTPTNIGVATVTLRVTDAGGRFTETTFTVSSVGAAVIPFTDTFTRPDAPNLGGNWVVQTGTVEVSFESTLATSPLVLATVNNVSQVNSVAQASVGLSAASGTSSAALVARMTGVPATASMYYAGVFLENGAVTARIYRQVNGVATELVRSAAFAGPVAPQYVLRFEVVNDSLKLFVDGNLSLFAYDTAIALTGQTGFRTTAANRLDTFSTDNIALTPPAPLPAPPGTTAGETFSQADGTQLSRDWRDRVGNLSVLGGAAVGQVAGTNLATYNVVQPTANAGAQVDVALAAVNQVAGIVLRYNGTPGANADANYYLGQVRRTGANSVIQLYRNVNGTFTQLGTDVAVAGTAGTFRFESNGNQLKLFFNNVRVLTIYDTNPAALTAAGSVGLRTNQGGAADNFVAFALGTNATLPAADAFPATPPLNQLSSQWTERSGSISVATGAAVSTGVSLATLNGVSAGDVAVSALLPTPSAGFTGLGLVARYQNEGNFYWGALNRYPPDANQFMAVIWKYVNGVATPVNLNTAVLPISQAVNGVLRFELLGSSFKLYLNDVIVSFGFDTTYTTGGVGIQLTNGAIVDDFAAVARAAVAPAVPSFADTFTAGLNPQNTLATDWQERSGAFSVSSAPATANRATGLSTSQANLAVVNGNTALTDVTVAADLFFTGANQTAGLVLRYQGTGGTGDRNFYFADLVTQANGDALVRIRKDVNGTKTTLQQVVVAGYFPGANFSPGTAPRLQFRVIGNTLSVFLDDLVTPLFSVADATAPFAAGSVGIRTSVGAGADNFLTS